MDQRNGTWKRVAPHTHAMRELRLSILGKRDWAGDGMKIVPYIFRLQTPCVSRIIVSVTNAPELAEGEYKTCPRNRPRFQPLQRSAKERAIVVLKIYQQPRDSIRSDLGGSDALDEL